MTQISSIARYLTGFKRGQKEKHCVLSMLLFFPHVLVLLTRCHARAIPRACGMLVRCRGFVEKIKKKIIWRKTVAIHNVFKEKTTKLIS